MKKRTFIIAIIVFLLIGGVILFKLNNSTVDQKTEDSVITFFDLLKNDTGINISEIEEGALQWNVVNEQKNIISVTKAGKEFSILNINAEDAEKIESFFQNNGFELDLYNVADGPEGSIEGYRKNKMYCIIERNNQTDNTQKLKIICAI